MSATPAAVACSHIGQIFAKCVATAYVRRVSASTPSIESRVRTLETDGFEVKTLLLRIESTMSSLDAKVSGLDSKVSGLDSKVSSLGSAVSAVELTLHGVELSVAELKGRISQLPTTIQMIMFVLGVLVIAGVGQFLSFRFPKP